MRTDVRDILFWIFLILGVVLLVWNVFGNSPTEFIALVAIMFTILLKIWSVSDRQLKSDMRFKVLARDFKLLSQDFKSLSQDFKQHTKHK